MKITWRTNMTKVEKDLQKRIPLDYGLNFPSSGLPQLMAGASVSVNRINLGETVGTNLDGVPDILSYYSFDKGDSIYKVYFIHDPSGSYIYPLMTRKEVIDIFMRMYRRRRDAEWEKYQQSGGMAKYLEDKRKRQAARDKRSEYLGGLGGLSK